MGFVHLRPIFPEIYLGNLGFLADKNGTGGLQKLRIPGETVSGHSFCAIPFSITVTMIFQCLTQSTIDGSMTAA
jgi:hypothetical protein